jgi:hypothetical protein
MKACRTLGVSNGRLAIVNASNESTLRTVLASVADKMLADFTASSVANHSGSKGTVREAQLLSNYLRKYLPRNVIAEHSGEVVAGNGEVSGQCDIVIVDPSTPPFWDDEDYRIVPAECLYGVIEVKSSLDATELRKAWKQIARVKALPKTAYFPAQPPRTRRIYGRDWPYVPTSGLVFAYDGISLDSLCDEFEQLADQYPHEHCPDSVWVLNKGFINWTNPENGKVDCGPEPDAGYMAVEATPQQILMPLTAHLHQHFGTAWMPPFNILDYMRDLPWGTSVRAGVPAEDPSRREVV